MTRLFLAALMLSGCAASTPTPIAQSQKGIRSYHTVEFRKSNGEWKYIEIEPEWDSVRIHRVDEYPDDSRIYTEIFSTK